MTTRWSASLAIVRETPSPSDPRTSKTLSFLSSRSSSRASKPLFYLGGEGELSIGSSSWNSLSGSLRISFSSKALSHDSSRFVETILKL